MKTKKRLQQEWRHLKPRTVRGMLHNLLQKELDALEAESDLCSAYVAIVQTIMFCLEYEPDDAALRRVAKLERLIVACSRPALSIESREWIGALNAQKLHAEAARIAKCKAGHD